MNRQDLNTLNRRFDKITALTLMEIYGSSVEEDIPVDLTEFLDWSLLFLEDYKVTGLLNPEKLEDKLVEYQIRIIRIAEEFLEKYGIKRELKVPDNKFLVIYTWDRRYRYFMRRLNHFIEDTKRLSEDESLIEALGSPLVYYMIYSLKYQDLSGNERGALRMKLNDIYKESVIRMMNRVTGARYYLNCDRLYVKGE